MKVLIMVMFFFTTIMTILFLSPNVWAEGTLSKDPQTQAANRESVISLMHEIFFSITSLRPYMVSEEKFRAPENYLVIDSELTQLKDKIKKAEHEPNLQTPSFKISRQVLQEHVAETQRVFRSGNKDYARWSLNSTMSMCMSCHSQLPSHSTTGLILEQSETFVKSFERAEWLFVARNFDKALELYNNSIRSFPANKLTTTQVEASLERQIAIHTRVKRDFSNAIVELQKDLKNDELPQYIQSNIRSWIKTLKKYESEKLPNPKTATPEEIRAFAENHLKTSRDPEMGENPKAAMYLTVSGILYEYLNLHPKTELAPELLYWLAQCDRGTNNNFFYSLADIYLKQCMLSYSAHPVAKQCYKDYELYTIASYSGSSGTHLPSDVADELRELGKLVNQPPTELRKK